MKGLKAMENYKPSMFNYVLDGDDNFVLYNSFQGTKSICSVSEAKKNKIKNWLSSSELNVAEDEDFEFLKARGIIIKSNVNEHNLRNLLYAQYVCDSTLSLVVHTTKDCNFRCQYCYLDFKSMPLTEEVQGSIIKFIQKNLHKYNAVRISWFGGEPLLEMGAIENISKKVMSLCNRAKKQYFSSITTNGYLLTPKNLEKLIAFKVNSYTITIDGLSETHDKLRYLKGKQPTFDKIISNLLYIKENIKCSKLRIVLRTNLTRDNARNINEYYTFFNEKFGNDKRFSLFVRPVRDAGGESVKEISDKLLTNAEMDYILHNLSVLSEKGNISFLSNYSELEPAGYTCPAICVGKYSIDVEGKVSKCDSIEEGLGIGYLDKDGNLIKEGTNEEDWMMGCFEHEQECENCFFSATCFKGTCPIGRTNGCKIPCKLRTNEIDALIEMFVKTEKVVSI